MESQRKKIPIMKNGTMFKVQENMEKKNGNQNLKMNKLT